MHEVPCLLEGILSCQGTLSVGIVKTKVTRLNLSCAPSSLNQQVILLIRTRKLLINLLSLISPLNLLKVIAADLELPVTSDFSVKAITIPSVSKHYYSDFILGYHNWKQKCMVDPPTLTVSVMIGLPTLMLLSCDTILNVVQSRPLEVITWMSKLEFDLRFPGPEKIPPFLLISGSILFMVKMVLSLVPLPVMHLV